MRLYYFETINPRKVCAVARYLNSPVEFIRVDLAKGEHKSPAYLAINPNGKVPVLADGSMRLWESNAIMCYLAKAAGSELWPSSVAGQIDVMRWLSWNDAHFTGHAGSLYFEYLIKPQMLGRSPDAAAVQEAQRYFRQFARVLNEHLRGRTHIAGDGLTIADFAVGISLPYAEQAKIPVAEFEEIARWYAGLDALPGWRQPFPDLKAAA